MLDLLETLIKRKIKDFTIEDASLSDMVEMYYEKGEA